MASNALAMNFMYLDHETPAGMTGLGLGIASVNSLALPRFQSAVAAVAPGAFAYAAPPDSS